MELGRTCEKDKGLWELPIPYYLRYIAIVESAAHEDTSRRLVWFLAGNDEYLWSSIV